MALVGKQAETGSFRASGPFSCTVTHLNTSINSTQAPTSAQRPRTRLRDSWDFQFRLNPDQRKFRHCSQGIQEVRHFNRFGTFFSIKWKHVDHRRTIAPYHLARDTYPAWSHERRQWRARVAKTVVCAHSEQLWSYEKDTDFTKIIYI